MKTGNTFALWPSPEAGPHGGSHWIMSRKSILCDGLKIRREILALIGIFATPLHVIALLDER